jgi:hypothetical protein
VGMLARAGVVWRWLAGAGVVCRRLVDEVIPPLCG